MASGVPVTALRGYDDAGRLAAARDQAGWPSDTGYGPDGEVTLTTDALGNTTAGYYDLAGQLVASRDELGRWTEVGYDARGRAVTVKDALGQVATTAYDLAGNATATTDALGRTLTVSYDALNRATGTQDALLRRTTVTFDAVGNVATASDHLGRVTSYAYDALNRATTVTEAVGTSVQRTVEVTFDEVGNVKAVKDGLGHRTTFSYDARDQRTEAQDALGRRVTTTYDEVGAVRTVKDPLGKVVTYGYDALHRQVSVTDPLGHVTTAVLDANGQQTARIDALGNVRHSLIDALGRAAGTVDALGGATAIAFDGSGGTRLVTDPVGNETRYVTDALGREAVRFDPTGAATTTAYDAIGRVTQETDRLGRTQAFSYDAGDRLSSEVWKTSGGTAVETLSYGWSDNDEVLTAASSQGTYTFTYDELGRTRTHKDLRGITLTYSYDAADRRTSVADSQGGLLTSAYDAAHRLLNRSLTGGGQAARVELAHSDSGERTELRRYADAAGSTLVGTSSYAYDDAGRHTSLIHKSAAGAPLVTYSWAYDAADRLATETRNGAAKTYSYDSTDQLTNDSTLTYSYDLNGNRTMAGHATGAANRLSTDGAWTYTYDAEGNLSKRSKGASAETWTYGYDHRNQLLYAEQRSADGGTLLLRVDYAYDAYGNLLSRADGSATKRYAYEITDASPGTTGSVHGLWAEVDGTGSVTTRYLLGEGDGERWARLTSTGVHWVAQDRLGSVREILDSTGAVVAALSYDGYGNVTSETAPSLSGDFGFTGLLRDAATTVYFAHWRAYGPGWGGWLTEDPWGFGPGDANLRRYVGNNPTSTSDLTGLFPGTGTRPGPINPNQSRPTGGSSGNAGTGASGGSTTPPIAVRPGWSGPDKQWVSPYLEGERQKKRYLDEQRLKVAIANALDVGLTQEEIKKLVGQERAYSAGADVTKFIIQDIRALMAQRMKENYDQMMQSLRLERRWPGLSVEARYRVDALERKMTEAQTGAEYYKLNEEWKKYADLNMVAMARKRTPKAGSNETLEKRRKILEAERDAQRNNARDPNRTPEDRALEAEKARQTQEEISRIAEELRRRIRKRQ